MITYIGFIVLGLGILVIAGDLLVRGAVNLAGILKVPTLLVSLTIIAFGTSAPEFVVTLQDVLTSADGQNGIAMGNIIGSNIANILLVLGLPAIIAPIAMTTPGLRQHAFFMLVATVMFLFFAYYRGVIDPLAGFVLMGTIFVYIIYVGFRAKTGHAEESVLDDLDEYQDETGRAWKTPAFLVAGLIGLPLGAKMLVDNGAAMATDLGVREELIGLTIVAFGTSLPELATVFAAAMKRHADVAVGNIVGSNIFNLLFVGGTAGLASMTATGNPSYFTVDARHFDMPVMLISTLVLIAMIYLGARINRFIGFGFLGLYLGYIAFLGFQSAVI
jgi:cation:H+ antiporter